MSESAKLERITLRTMLALFLLAILMNIASVIFLMVSIDRVQHRMDYYADRNYSIAAKALKMSETNNPPEK